MSDDALKAARVQVVKMTLAGNANLITIHSLQKVLEAHGIKFDNLDTSKLKVENGKVAGEFEYTVPSGGGGGGGNPPGAGGGGSPGGAKFTTEELKAMTPEQINENWDAVAASLSES